MNKQISTPDGPVIVWFRRDLRLQNNPALSYALATGCPVIPIYIHEPEVEQPWAPGGASRWWLHNSLQVLGKNLQQLGLQLHLYSGNTVTILRKLVSETRADMLAWNNLYEPYLAQRDAQLQSTFKNIAVQRFDSGLFFTPGTLLNKQQQPYRVFTPFWKAARLQLETQGVQVESQHYSVNVPPATAEQKNSLPLHKLALLGSYPWHEKLANHWQPGENAALSRLDEFLEEIIPQYDSGRDIPGLDGTSKLSAHLHFGEITPQQIYYQILQRRYSAKQQPSVERFLSELGWREFAHHVLWHFPQTTIKPMNEKFTNFWPRKADQKLLQKWQQGKTGIAIVDAGMRQLWETGWMHNRVRMIVGSLLTKNLGIHWLHGAKWFWDTLVDADLANNTLGWQWVAGCGVDAAPYYRIFNPDTQAQRFDPKDIYIRQWVPEVDQPGSLQSIVDLKASRAQALQHYKSFM